MPVMLLEGHLSPLPLFSVLLRASFVQVQVTACKQVFPFEQQLSGLLLL